MAARTTPAHEVLTKWSRDDFKQYNRSHRYKSYIGMDQNSIIQRNTDLKEDGESVRLFFTDDLARRNIGTGTLAGNEATWGSDYYDLMPIWVREAIKIKKSEAKRSALNQYRLQRSSLKTFVANTEYQQVIDGFNAIAYDASAYADSGAADGSTRAHVAQVTYQEASEAQRDAYVLANADRVQFGAVEANLVSGDMSASLLNVDGTADKASGAGLELFKRRLQRDLWASGGARPLRPVSTRDEKGREFFKVLMGEVAFTHFSDDEDVKKANTEARLRGVEDHPLFQDGDLIYKGMIIHFEPRLTNIGTVGAASLEVEPVHVLGAQAMGQAVGQKYRYTNDSDDDYGFFENLGVEEQCSFEKLIYQGGARAGKMHGMGTWYVAGA